MLGQPDFPFMTNQEMNLDWLLSEFAKFKKSMIPQVNIDVLTEANNSGVLNTLNRYNNKIPLGTSVIHLGRYVDATQVFILVFRASEESGTANIYTTGRDITLSVLNMVDGVWIAGAAPEYGTNVIANPVLSGTETNLTGLQVGDTKYKVPSGGGGGVLVVNATIEGTTITLNKTWQEITDASFPVIVAPDGTGGVAWNTIRSTYLDNGDYTVEMVVGNVGESRSLSYAVMYLTANSANGYPAMSMGA